MNILIASSFMPSATTWVPSSTLWDKTASRDVETETYINEHFFEQIRDLEKGIDVEFLSISSALRLCHKKHSFSWPVSKILLPFLVHQSVTILRHDGFVMLRPVRNTIVKWKKLKSRTGGSRCHQRSLISIFVDLWWFHPGPWNSPTSYMSYFPIGNNLWSEPKSAELCFQEFWLIIDKSGYISRNILKYHLLSSSKIIALVQI